MMDLLRLLMVFKLRPDNHCWREVKDGFWQQNMELSLKSAHCATERDGHCMCAVQFDIFDEAVDYQWVVKKELQGIK